MIAVVQRVKKGSVRINNRVFSQIRQGYVILVGVFENDSEDDVTKLTKKITHLRIMSDKQGKMNKSIIETGGEILLVSQFTLCADLTQGRRPSFIKAKNPQEAEKLYQLFIQKLQQNNIPVKTGRFGQYMTVEIVNDGPVTIIVDSKKI